MKLTVNLQEKMIAGKRISAQEQLVLDEANQLLAGLQQRDNEILSHLGLDRNIREANKIERIQSKLSRFDQSRVFHIDEIKKICCDYYLKFLPASRYKGTICPLLATKIAEFQGEYSYPVHAGTSYIAAPDESFDLTPMPEDPLFFAELAGDYYYLVHKWGNDISLTRKWFGWWKDSNKDMIGGGMIGGAVAFMLGLVCVCIMNKGQLSLRGLIGSIYFGVVFSFILSWLFLWADGSNKHEEKWNKSTI